jgi:hypothetical protein
MMHRLFTQSLLTLSIILAFSPIGSAASVISYWNFDETDGNSFIDSFGDNNGVLGSGITRVPGIIGSGALSFANTSNAYADVGLGVGNNFSVTDGISITAVINSKWTGQGFSTNQPFDYDEIFRKEDGDNRILLSFQNDYGVYAIPGPVLSFGLNVGGSYAEMDTPLAQLGNLLDGMVHYVAATYDSATRLQKLYIDGNLVNSLLRTQGDGKVRSGGGASGTIGNITPGGGEPFNGTIDELGIYNGALTADEVAQQATCFEAGKNYLSCSPTMTSVPEPSSSMGVLGLATVGAVVLVKRKLKSA